MTLKEWPSEDKEGGVFLKLSDGESASGVVRGEVLFGESDYEGQVRTRFRVNFVTEENGALVSKIWEGGSKVYKQLENIASKNKLEETKVVVQRTGEKKATQWAVVAAGSVSDAEKQMLPLVQLKDLTFKK